MRDVKNLKFKHWCDGVMSPVAWDLIQLMEASIRTGHILYKGIFLQYTGIKDSHNLDVFEGDIVKQQSENEWGSFSEMIGEVVWCDGHLGWEVRSKDYDPMNGANMLGHKCEVIGNIYETPNLMPR